MYVNGLHFRDMLHFLTADGVSCRWVNIQKAFENPNNYAGITCEGNIPGIPDSVLENGGLGCAKVGAPNGFTRETFSTGIGAAVHPLIPLSCR